MKYVQINAYSTGWAESVIFDRHRELIREGHDSYVFWGVGKQTIDDHQVRLVSDGEHFIDKLLTRFDGRYSFHSRRPTARLLKHLDQIDPDVVHLHSLLGNYLNIEMLFKWLEKSKCNVIWTLHDCWAFTGFCMYFTAEDCSMWKSCCDCSCPRPIESRYPAFGLKTSIKRNYQDKKRIFNLLSSDRLTIYTPSEWLARLVRESFLAKYPIEVHNNNVNRAVFVPTNSDYRARYGVGDKFMILGVASPWTERKGLNDFVRLNNELGDSCAIVVIGLDSKQIRHTKGSLIALPRTESQKELVEAYSAADVFFNPTREDNYPTVNLEAEACGTPVITYNVGGCAETLRNPRSLAVSGFSEALAVFKIMKERKTQFLVSDVKESAGQKCASLKSI